MSETILIVDDNYATANLMQYTILPLGYDILYAADGHEGFEMAISHRPDLIMTDMNMPRMDGIELLTALRQADCQTPVIFMTVHGSENIAVRVFRLGVQDYLIKPFTKEEAKESINKALQSTRLAREKETLIKELLTVQLIRQTAGTLAHYINNQLMIADGGLSLLHEALQQDYIFPNHSKLLKLASDSLTSVRKIDSVLETLQSITKVELTKYSDQLAIFNLEAALAYEASKEDSKNV